ncbi:hypothetical protein ACHAPJ_008986 [Fusarium lateritium]
MSHPDEVFFVVVISVFYLSEEWELTRELSYVAISESLIHDLAKIAGTPLPSIQVLEQAPMVASLAAFGSLLNRVPKDNLTAYFAHGNGRRFQGFQQTQTADGN